MNKKYYVAPAVAVEHVEMESLCAASGGLKESGSDLSGSLNNPEQGGNADGAAGKINIHDVWE